MLKQLHLKSSFKRYIFFTCLFTSFLMINAHASALTDLENKTVEEKKSIAKEKYTNSGWFDNPSSVTVPKLRALIDVIESDKLLRVEMDEEGTLATYFRGNMKVASILRPTTGDKVTLTEYADDKKHGKEVSLVKGRIDFVQGYRADKLYGLQIVPSFWVTNRRCKTQLSYACYRLSTRVEEFSCGPMICSNITSMRRIQ